MAAPDAGAIQSCPGRCRAVVRLPLGPDQSTISGSKGARQPAEMHAWVGIVATQEIVDIACYHFPEVIAGSFAGSTLDDNRRKIAALDWPGDKPPEFLWCHAHKLPERVYYRPLPEPSILAARVWSRVKEGVCL
jgi:hypothetical protein